MSHAVTASRGSASRMVRRSASSGSPRRSAMRCLTAATRAEPSSRGGPGSLSARAARTALASPTRPSASYVAPIRAGSASTWISRPERRSAYWPVVSAPSSVPTASRTSASPSSSRIAGSSSAVPSASGSSSGKAPLPMYVVATGAPSRSATSAKLVPGARRGGRRPRPRRRVARPSRAGRPPRRAASDDGSGRADGVVSSSSRPARRSRPRARRPGSRGRPARSAASAPAARPPRPGPGSPRPPRREPPTSRRARRRPSGRGARAGSPGRRR